MGSFYHVFDCPLVCLCVCVKISRPVSSCRYGNVMPGLTMSICLVAVDLPMTSAVSGTSKAMGQEYREKERPVSSLG